MQSQLLFLLSSWNIPPLQLLFPKSMDNYLLYVVLQTNPKAENKIGLLYFILLENLKKCYTCDKKKL